MQGQRPIISREDCSDPFPMVLQKCLRWQWESQLGPARRSFRVCSRAVSLAYESGDRHCGNLVTVSFRLAALPVVLIEFAIDRFAADGEQPCGARFVTGRVVERGFDCFALDFFH